MALAVIIALAAALRFWGIDGQSFWSDEYFTHLHASQAGFGAMLSSVSEEEVSPPLYHVLAWLWVHAFGTGDAGLKSLSALLGTATVPVVYVGVHQLASRRAALVAAALVATSPLLVWYSQEARPYSLLILLSAASFAFFARALRAPSRGALAGWAAASSLALASHYLAGLLIVPEAALLFVRLRESRRAVAVATGVVALVVAALLPTVLGYEANPTNWISQTPLDERLIQTSLLFGVGQSYPPGLAVAAAGLLAVGLSAVLLARADPEERRVATLALYLFAGGMAVALLGVAVGQDLIIARYLLALWVPLAVAVAVGFGSRRAGAVGAGATIVLCGLWTALSIEVKDNEDIQRIDWRAAAELVGDERRRLIAAPSSYHHLPLLIYLDGIRQQPPLATNRVSEVVELTHDRPSRGKRCWWGAACGLSSENQPRIVLPGGFRLVERTSLGRFTASRYVSARPLPVTAPPAGELGVLLQTGT
ncbi:MAG: glycosyltransferase family 39 protein [Solirubrobacterales bacterium]